MKVLGFRSNAVVWLNELSIKGDNFYHVCIAKANTSPIYVVKLVLFCAVRLYPDFLKYNLLEKCCSGSTRRHFCNWQWKDYDPLQ